MRFEFATATRIIFGQGTINEVAPSASEMGKKALLVRGKNTDRAEPLLESLGKQNIQAFTFSVPGEPGIDIILAGLKLAREKTCDLVIAMGGGSVIDAGKAIAALLNNQGDIMDYLEVIGRAQPLQHAPLPFIAVPTTAGTGAEVSRNSVIFSPEHRVKVSLRSPLMLPELAVVDPELTYSMPPSLTGSTGMDALTQNLEAFVSLNANPMADATCKEGIKRAARSLGRAVADGTDSEAREDMAVASLFGGLAVANAKLGAVHGIAGPMGGMFPIPHGVICACLLPFVMEANIRALHKQGASQFLKRYDEVARLLTGESDATAEDGINWTCDLYKRLDIPGLSDFGITPDHFPELCERSKRASSMKGNPVGLSDEELMKILEKAVLPRK